MKLFTRLAFAALFILISVNSTYAQTKTKAEKKAAERAKIKEMVEAQNFVFKATNASPMRGGNRQLTSDYDFTVGKDTVVAFLPYFGRAFVAPNPGTTDGGIKVNTTRFSYSSVQKGGGWNIIIKPKDKNIADWRDVQSFNLSISQDGYGSLQVISTNRDAITFTGYIEARSK
ncbi:uncharacterized protein DUF4251 [Mucilaginibacter oryzae]|uniref:Uncharacterized protein DUF4251 n=1 Tax=Mucilaginibacter oryzae TaxID=468058 RepID=A0A316HA97_9SPHI|nr:DUF4251 domain-containing protein [Mucilaginibacter oryzae]PWK77378.1 uncharacterized protein DUF4251 [Mucilaginibacter oryzae]